MGPVYNRRITMPTIVVCSRCGDEIGKDSAVHQQLKGDHLKKAGAPSKMDLCNGCAKEHAILTKGFLLGHDDDEADTAA
jgi:hypothetical protein